MDVDCNIQDPCGAKHCLFCVSGTVKWFHIPATAKVGKPKHRKKGPVRAYLGL